MFRYYFSGRVHPERANVWIGNHHVRAKLENLAWFDVVYEVECCQINVFVSSEGRQKIESLRYLVEELINAQINLLGYLNGCGYQVEIVSGFDEEVKKTVVFGVAIDEFHSEYNNKKDSVGFLEEYKVGARWAYESVPLRRALSDFGQALRNPKDTAFYCFRALETLREQFKEDENEEERITWEKMGSSLNVHRSISDYIRHFAQPQRHGEIKTMNNDERIRVLDYSRKVVQRFINFLEEGATLDPNNSPEMVHS